MEDYLCIENTNFSSDLTSSLSLLLTSSSLCDCTLVCEDGQVAAHKVILAATSTFFSSVFQLNHHNHPLIYLRGVRIGQVQSLLQFVYNGVTRVAEEDVNSFMFLASDLKIRGMEEKEIESKDKIEVDEEISMKFNEAENTVRINNDPLCCVTHVEEPSIIGAIENTIDKSVHVIKVEQITESPTPANQSSMCETNLYPNINHRANTVKVEPDKIPIMRERNTKHRQKPSIRTISKHAPFTCPGCKAKIFSSFLLKHHMKSKHESQCENCHLYFNSCQSLTDHKKGRCKEKVLSKC